MHSSVRSCRLIPLLLMASSFAWSQSQSKPAINDFDLLDTVYQKMNASYVDKLNLSAVIRKGFNASLSSLDPYSSYISKEEAEEFQMSLAGKLGGVGLVIRSIDGRITIGELYKGYPSDKAGLKVGDVIRQVDNVSLEGKTLNEVPPLLRGTPGTTVKIVIERPGSTVPITTTLTRELITLPVVPYYGMVDENIGYIRLTYESATSADETTKALKDLQSTGKLKGLILDLRDNFGGYELQALRIINLFVGKGKAILSERNRFGDTTFYTMSPALDSVTPIAILVNNATISAAEIISGAIQDLDRGIIVGQKTYGKGLVQNLFKMPTGEILRITTAYYHTPSGRCIQNKSYDKQSAGTIIADSLKTTFKTSNGRLVKNHDGISPDVPMEIVPPALITTILTDDYQTNNIVFNFATQYCLRHPTPVSARAFRLSDEEYAKFNEFVKASKLQYETEAEKKLEEFKKTAMTEGDWSKIKTQYEALRAQLFAQKERDLGTHQAGIRALIEREIVSRYYYQAGRLEKSISDDEMVIRTIEILKDRAKYRKLLGYAD